MAQRTDKREARHEDTRVHAFMEAPPAEQARFMAQLGLRPASALIFVNACANQCFFCASEGTVGLPRSRWTPWERLKAHLEAPRPEGVELLLIGGNEPTMHPDFERALALARPAGYREVQLMTSGLALADPQRLARWVDHGLSSVAVPLYAADADEHDRVCGTPCFEQTLAGLDAAHAAGVTIHLHTLALRRTAERLPELAALARERFDATLAIAPLREKDGLFVWDDEALTFPQLEAALADVPHDPHITLTGYPACVARDRPRGCAEVIHMYFRTQLAEFAPVCEGCLDRPTCRGVVRAFLRHRGAEGLSPRH